jgi:cation diffusion facilitator CzcD-associated flavoprotein CzcO
MAGRAPAGTGTGTVIVGAGPAGLAVAACLRRRGVTATVLDAGSEVGASWRERYDRLHLHTPRRQSGLPGHPIPRRCGRWISRDDLAAYLGDYARHHGIAVEHGVVVDRIDRHDGRLRLSTGAGPREAAHVVVATGYTRVPVMPGWPGLEDHPGEVLHAAGYRSPAPYRDRRVLVVGTGNSGAEIAADLAEHGAARVWLSYRTPPHVLPRQVGPIPTTILGMPNEYAPARLVDAIGGLLERLTTGDLSAHGLPRPTIGLKSQFLRSHVVPVLDVGLVDQIRAGRVEPVAAVASFAAGSVVLVDGRAVDPDVVIAATGYQRGLEGLVGHLGVLDATGAPTVHGPRTHPGAPGLHFIGMLPTFKGLLFQINRDARAIARRIAPRERRQPVGPKRSVRIRSGA